MGGVYPPGGDWSSGTHGYITAMARESHRSSSPDHESVQDSDKQAEEMQKTLDDLGDEIGDARRQAEDSLERGEQGPQYHQSGDVHPAMDDQAVTPPG